jgi:enoyl-CoA hydratase
MPYDTIVVTKEETLGVITLNRPDALNALNSRMVEEILSALRAFESDEDVRCVIITGNEKVFCAGADIKEMATKTTVDFIRSSSFLPLWKGVAAHPKPIIAALSGYVLGGGLELAMACDILIASETAKLGQPEINIGIIPGGGGTQRLTRAVGRYKAMEMILTGSPITAEDARQHGLVNRVVPREKFLDEAKLVAKEIASKSPLATRMAKQAINKAHELGITEGIEFERQLFYHLFSTQDKEEGMRAFLEKRKPEFRGK